jgi:hypothetical protein
MTARADKLSDWVSQDPLRWAILKHVHSLELLDFWVAAGFVRNLAWSRLHGREAVGLSSDVDVIWFEFSNAVETRDRSLEAQLRKLGPAVK